MKVTPNYNAVGQFFRFQPVYRVPAYQRSYSWEQLEVEDFLKDLATCYEKRKYEGEVIHFFGQIVCIEDKLQSADNLSSFQLVDGQQRIATFTLLVLALINIYESIISDIEADPDMVNQMTILKGRIKSLTNRYISFQKEVGEEFQSINVLELSNRDKTFYRNFLQDTDTPCQKESHKLIKSAYDMIYAKVSELTNSGIIRDRIGNLKMIELILETDFCILNMITEDRKAAFKLFQVLNNRGKNLTEGDLLRAESLRILEPYIANQSRAEEAWDNILDDTPLSTEIYLRAIYASYIGQKASTNSLFNEFLDAFIPEYEHEAIEAHQALAIQEKINSIENDVITLRKLADGQWPYEQRQPIEHWDRNRLHLLIEAFDHLESLPFLLAATLLDHQEFNKIIQVLEKFVFRYLIVCNQYIGDLITVYAEEAKKIRDNPGGYSIINLKQRLQPLEAKADNATFFRLLDEIKYQKAGKSNKPVKYLLLTCEYYYRWFKDGAAGDAICLDKERVYDFGDSTLEHIYPHNATGAVVQGDLEPLKNTIGNLTILGNVDNRTGDNDDFATKRPIYAASSLMMNRDEISPSANWTKVIIEQRTTNLKNMAIQIFKL